jgi:hypothetical protein
VLWNFIELSGCEDVDGCSIDFSMSTDELFTTTESHSTSLLASGTTLFTFTLLSLDELFVCLLFEATAAERVDFDDDFFTW